MIEDSLTFAHRLALADMNATAALGARIAQGLKVGDAVALTGDLGAGKTALARTILRALGVVEEVPSPTFTLVQLYETEHLTVRHYDLYRIETPSELEELGLDEALSEGAALIEWPERAEAWLPTDRLTVALTITGDEARLAELSGPAKWRAVFATVPHAS